jgi:hypothetical protein
MSFNGPRKAMQTVRNGDSPRKGLFASKLRSSVLLISIILLIGAPLPLRAQQLKASEADVKSAFLFNFGKYVTWPRDAGDRFSICILGSDPLGTSLDKTVSGEKIASKPAEVRRIHDARDASACNVVFVSSSEAPRLESILGELAKHPVLTVSDMARFTERGGMIEFVNEGNRVRFQVNLGAAQTVGLVLSSELLKVAKSVKRDDTRGAM